MQSVALAVPIQPGKTQAFRDYVAELTGPRRSDEEAFHRKVGTHREAAWLQQTPQGDLVVIYWEGEDPERYKEGLEQLLRSDEPFAQWLRERFADIYGIDPEASLPPMPEQVLDLRLTG